MCDYAEQASTMLLTTGDTLKGSPMSAWEPRRTPVDKHCLSSPKTYYVVNN